MSLWCKHTRERAYTRTLLVECKFIVSLEDHLAINFKSLKNAFDLAIPLLGTYPVEIIRNLAKR